MRSECARPKRRDRGPSAFALRPDRFPSGSREPDHARVEPPVGGHLEARAPRSRPEMSRTPPPPPGRSADARRFAMSGSSIAAFCRRATTFNFILGHGVTLLLERPGGL